MVLGAFVIVAAIAWFIIKDVPGGLAQKYTPNAFRLKPWDLA